MRDESSIHFWKDQWLPEGNQLYDERIAEIPNKLLDSKVGQFFIEEAEWNVDLFSPFLS